VVNAGISVLLADITLTPDGNYLIVICKYGPIPAAVISAFVETEIHVPVIPNKGIITSSFMLISKTGPFSLLLFISFKFRSFFPCR
jgi:hypothetical protein